MENVKENISAHRTTSIIVGILILAAYSVIAGGNPDARILGMAVEVFSGIAVIIIAILMFRIFMPFDKKLSGWYLVFRLLEGALLVVTGILFLSSSDLPMKVYDGIHVGHGYIFGIAALIFNTLLFRTRLVPRWLSVFGIAATLLLLVVNLLEVTGIISELMILKLPIFANEIILALWLIIKGFRPSAFKP